MVKDGTLFNPYIYQDDPWPVLGEAFLEGKVGMYLGSNGMFSLYNQWAKDAGFELALAVQPSKDGKPSIATGAGNIIMFNDSSEAQKKAAGDFIAFLASDKYAAGYTILTGYLPTTKSALKDPQLQSWIAGAPEYQSAIDQMQYAHKRPLTKNWRNIYTRLVEDLEHCLRDTGINPASAMAEAARACQRIVDDNP
jgi:sn-glycerol 3-phosphate transport system substrate-binding protein